MGIVSLTLGIVALFTWVLPPLGFIIGILGLIFGIIALVKKREKRRAIAGLRMSSVGIIFSIAVLVGLIAGALIMEQLRYDYFWY